MMWLVPVLTVGALCLFGGKMTSDRFTWAAIAAIGGLLVAGSIFGQVTL